MNKCRVWRRRRRKRNGRKSMETKDIGRVKMHERKIEQIERRKYRKEGM